MKLVKWVPEIGAEADVKRSKSDADLESINSNLNDGTQKSEALQMLKI